ncbi:hypothetical protein B0J14DRAFT_646101 [Halenospora varia]|nr:hypothetical protein B0J14DRAFT_646101 [Halenospora varia]
MSNSTSSASSISTTTISASSSIASFNRGPVTAQFTPPKSCLSTLTFGTDMYFGHSGYAYDGSDHQCRSAFTSTTSNLAYISPTTNGNNQWTNTAASNVGTTIAAANPTYNVYGDGVAVWWEQSDLAIFAAASAKATTTSPTTSPTVSPTTTQKVSPTSSPSPSPTRSGGLSTGAKIGIGVGVPLAVIAIGVIGAFIWFRKRGRRAVIPVEMADNKPPEQESTVSELYSDGLYDPHHPRGHHELPGQSIEPR